ncbi:MAG: hypothetical protein V1740_01020 [Candidatus Woesearchaeota archaeon]
MKINNPYFNIGLALIIAVFSLAIFGLTGLLTIIIIFLFFILPFYLILRKTNLQRDEKIFLPFFIGIGLFSTIAYYLAFPLNSIKISAVVTFILLIIIGLVLNYYLKKPDDSHNHN